MIQQHLIATSLSNSMSCIFIHVSSSAWNALLALPSWEIPGSDIISLVLFSSSLGWVNLCCLCVFSELVLWPLGHSPLFVYMSTCPSGQEWVTYGASPWHQHPIWDWPRVGVINIPWVESNWISLLPGPVCGAVSFSHRFRQVTPGHSRLLEVFDLFQVKQCSSVHLLLMFSFSSHDGVCPVVFSSKKSKSGCGVGQV